jgi:trehalose 6-phosphate synthase/phosphatase
VGWPGAVIHKIQRDKKRIKRRLATHNCSPVFLAQREVDNYYHGYCNKTLWPLFHYFTQRAIHDKKYWKSYKRVNELFRNVLCKVTQSGDVVWIHDYQLMLLPRMLRDKIPDATIGFFLHIPFPSSEVFRLLPDRSEIIEGILGADLVGFHTHDYVHHFTETVRRLTGYEYSLGQISAGVRAVRVDAFPLGIDYKRYSTNTPSIEKESNRLLEKLSGRKAILSIDRLDYTKGIPERLEAFDLFLEKYPHYRNKVTLILVVVPSRTGVKEYMLLKQRVDELISRINGKYGDIGWVPIWYLYRFLNLQKLVPLYKIADVALTTPLRDGMNLIAKEFIASKEDRRGVLILSEMAGAAQEMGEAILVNPNNKEEIADAIEQALTMPVHEQVRRNEIMQRRLLRYNVERWAHDFMERLHDVKQLQKCVHVRTITPHVRKQMRTAYRKSKNRLLLLDYDGTLVTFTENPLDARPNRETQGLLKKLCADPKNDVIIVSGRTRGTLEQWFGMLDLSLIAEHGVWIKKKHGKWKMLEALSSDWKQQIKPILELYADRTPGSFIEEKEFSLVWHYRKTEPKLAAIRARELKSALRTLTGNLNLGLLEGSKVIEIKNTGINKGRAAQRWLTKRSFDFVLAIGDDWTDEDIFAVLPASAYSVKVGYGMTKALFSLENPSAVRTLLKTLVKASAV